MATLYKQGTEVDRIEMLKCTMSLRSNGQVLRNRGDGWKLVVLKPHVSADFYWNKLKAKQETLSTEFKAYRKAVLAEFSLGNRWKYLSVVDLLGDDVDGIWSTLDDEGMHVDLETLTELNTLREALTATKVTLEPIEV